MSSTSTSLPTSLESPVTATTTAHDVASDGEPTSPASSDQNDIADWSGLEPDEGRDLVARLRRRVNEPMDIRQVTWLEMLCGAIAFCGLLLWLLTCWIDSRRGLVPEGLNKVAWAQCERAGNLILVPSNLLIEWGRRVSQTVTRIASTVSTHLKLRWQVVKFLAWMVFFTAAISSMLTHVFGQLGAWGVASVAGGLALWKTLPTLLDTLHRWMSVIYLTLHGFVGSLLADQWDFGWEAIAGNSASSSATVPLSPTTPHRPNATTLPGAPIKQQASSHSHLRDANDARNAQDLFGGFAQRDPTTPNRPTDTALPGVPVKPRPACRHHLRKTDDARSAEELSGDRLTPPALDVTVPLQAGNTFSSIGTEILTPASSDRDIKYDDIFLSRCHGRRQASPDEHEAANDDEEPVEGAIMMTQTKGKLPTRRSTPPVEIRVQPPSLVQIIPTQQSTFTAFEEDNGAVPADEMSRALGADGEPSDGGTPDGVHPFAAGRAMPALYDEGINSWLVESAARYLSTQAPVHQSMQKDSIYITDESIVTPPTTPDEETRGRRTSRFKWPFRGILHRKKTDSSDGSPTKRGRGSGGGSGASSRKRSNSFGAMAPKKSSRDSVPAHLVDNPATGTRKQRSSLIGRWVKTELRDAFLQKRETSTLVPDREVRDLRLTRHDSPDSYVPQPRPFKRMGRATLDGWEWDKGGDGEGVAPSQH